MRHEPDCEQGILEVDLEPRRRRRRAAIGLGAHRVSGPMVGRRWEITAFRLEAKWQDERACGCATQRWAVEPTNRHGRSDGSTRSLRSPAGIVRKRFASASGFDMARSERNQVKFRRNGDDGQILGFGLQVADIPLGLVAVRLVVDLGNEAHLDKNGGQAVRNRFRW